MSKPYISTVCPLTDCHNSSILDAIKRNNSSSSSRRQPSRVDSICTEGSSNSSPTGVKKLKKFQTIWSTIKRFSPVHRIKNSYNRRKLFERTERLYSSHPDISCNNLVVLTQIDTKRSRDDTDAITLTKSSRNKHSSQINHFFADNSDIIYSFNNSNPNLHEMNSIEAENVSIYTSIYLTSVL
ncbi:unnamed protein product [Medioppia subpectinata]|uniref:Uncharacterized protein n=1 Tax=Medioppia subpectinata TaxID=1979941 RepID=A0A7R9LUL0_9ACAR|nr:unnamed protein product [Medioppia subpectinata]CAG2121899.1 unnamed protein product [Medioppia subpectinata]